MKELTLTHRRALGQGMGRMSPYTSTSGGAPLAHMAGYSYESEFNQDRIRPQSLPTSRTGNSKGTGKGNDKEQHGPDPECI